MKYSRNKDVDKLVKQLVHLGWEYERGSKHAVLRDPLGTTRLTVSVTPSDWRCIHHLRQEVRRYYGTKAV